MTNILTPGNSWYRSLLWVDICAKPVQVANGNHVQSIGKQGMSWLGQGRRGCFCSSRHSAPSLGSVLHLRTKAANTKRSGLGTRPEFYTIWWSSPEWHVSPLLQKAKKGVERGWKQKINQRSQAYWVSKNGMGPAIVWCHHDLYTGSCGHCGPFKDVWESTLKNQYTQSLRDSDLDRQGQPGRARHPAQTWLEGSRQTTLLSSLALSESTPFSSPGPSFSLCPSHATFLSLPTCILGLPWHWPCTLHTFLSFLRMPTAPTVWIGEFTLERNHEAARGQETCSRRLSPWQYSEVASSALSFLPRDFLSQEKTQLLPYLRPVLWVFCHRKLNLTFIGTEAQGRLSSVFME